MTKNIWHMFTFHTDRDGESIWIHCALCHDDIQPEQYWFPNMYEALEAIASHMESAHNGQL